MKKTSIYFMILGGIVMVGGYFIFGKLNATNGVDSHPWTIYINGIKSFPWPAFIGLIFFTLGVMIYLSFENEKPDHKIG